MTTYAFDIPSPLNGTVGVPKADTQTQLDSLWGSDVWFDVRQDVPDYVTTPAGDWQLVDGEEALKQSLRRRWITSPGEYAVLPNYGAGVRDFVKGIDTKTTRAELADRIRSQALQDPRVEAVQQVTITTLDGGGGVKIYVLIVPRARTRPDHVIPVVIEVT